MQNENFKEIKINIQTVGVEMNGFLRQQIINRIQKLKGFLPGANWIDMYLKHAPEHSIDRRELSVRFGTPGPYIIASDIGCSWNAMLKNAEKTDQVIEQKQSNGNK